MLAILALALVAQSTGGPSARYQANVARAAGEADFSFARYAIPANGRAEFEMSPAVMKRYLRDLKPFEVVEGAWASDGDEWRIVQRPEHEGDEPGLKPSDFGAAATRRRQSTQSGFDHVPEVSEDARLLEDVELVADSRSYVFRRLADGNTLQVRTRPLDEVYSQIVSPFTVIDWCVRLDGMIARAFAVDDPEYSKRLEGDEIVEHETRRRGVEGDWMRLEVDYAPNWGYLPRRILKVTRGPRAAKVCDYVLFDAALCDKGGFVPSEWVTCEYNVTCAPNDMREFELASDFVPDGEITLGYFKASTITSRRREIRVEPMEGAAVLEAPGGKIEVEPSGEGLTLRGIRERLEAKGLTLPTPEGESSHAELLGLITKRHVELTDERKGTLLIGFAVFMFLLAALVALRIRAERNVAQ